MLATRTTLAALLAFSTAIAAGCGASSVDPEANDAFLTIQGNKSIALDYGKKLSLTVRYHNGADQGLTGQIDFEILGTHNGSTISSTSATTDGDGRATIELAAGKEDASFSIVAKAEFATDASWSVSVSQDGKPLPLSIEGTYAITSQFDLAESLPDVVKTFTKIGKSPGKWFVKRFLKAVDFSLPGFVEDVIGAMIDDNLDRNLSSGLTGFKAEIQTISDKFGQAAKSLGTTTTLVVTKSGDAFVGKHTMDGFIVGVDGRDVPFTLEELDVDSPVVENIAMSVDTADAVTMAQHDMPLRYGGFLALVVDKEIIPSAFEGARSFEEYLVSRFDCGKIGASLAENELVRNFLNASDAAGYCQDGLKAGAQIAINEIKDLDDHIPLTLRITGTGKAKDANGDRKADSIVHGKWGGVLDFAGSEGALVDGKNTFEAARDGGAR